MLYGEFFFENFYFLKHFDAIFQLYRELIKQKIWHSLGSKSTASPILVCICL